MNSKKNLEDSLEALGGALRARPRVTARVMEEVRRAGANGPVLGHSGTGWPAMGAPGAMGHGRRRIFAVAASAIAATGIILLASIMLFPSRSTVWADVVRAVQAKAWIHGILRGAAANESREFWISTSQGCGGSRSSEGISYFDDRLRIVYRYDVQKKILYRLPAATEELAQGEQIREIFRGLFRGDAEVKTEFSGMVLKEQKRTQTEKEGRKWDEYELHFQVPSRPDDDLRMSIIVDGQTHLPSAMMKKGIGGASIEWAFDYPEVGPADIYALGVPKDAQLVDRVPVGDMSRILAALQAGWDRFDEFQAIVIRNDSPDLFPTAGKPIPMAFLVWKKGSRWRVETALPPQAYFGNSFPADKDKGEFMRELFKKAYFTTRNVCDGKKVYEGDREGFRLLGDAEQSRHLCQEVMNAMPATWCYPYSFPAPNDRTEEMVNLKPTEGPANTILVTSRLVDLRGQDPARTFKFQRYWLDPQRGDAVVQNDMFMTDPAMKEPVNQHLEILMDQWEQTPKGIWYAARVQSGAQGHWFHFFLDFKAEIPDELFKPGRRTVLTERYPVGS